MSTQVDAVRLARRWLLDLEPESEEQIEYCELGIRLAEAALDAGQSCPEPDLEPDPELDPEPVQRLPQAADLIAMDRDALVVLCRAYPGGGLHDTLTAAALAYLALSYARSDDLQAVAGLLRLCAKGEADAWLTADAWRYVLDQQQPDGSFGLLSAELTILAHTDALTPRLAMTVEVLWALAAQNRGSAGALGTPRPAVKQLDMR